MLASLTALLAAYVTTAAEPFYDLSSMSFVSEPSPRSPVVVQQRVMFALTDLASSRRVLIQGVSRRAQTVDTNFAIANLRYSLLDGKLMKFAAVIYGVFAATKVAFLLNRGHV